MSPRRAALLATVLSLALAGAARAGAGRAGATPSAALDSLVASERAFAGLSATSGVRTAFLEYLAPGGIIFRPRPEPGRPAWESRGPVPAKLLWEPRYAEVAAAGDLGWTTGPWELRPDDAKRPTAYGHFVSVWQRQADGAWRVAVDIGIGHAKPAHGLGEFDPERQLERGPTHPAPRGATAAPDLQALDRALTRDAAARGAVRAFARWAARDVWLDREEMPPVRGAAGATEVLRTVPGTAAWSPLAQVASSSADLGCTYGYVERRAAPGAAPDSSTYVHVWRRQDGAWKLALELESPLPQKR
jgi:ketosteroid isomerase-like protein